MNLEEVFISKGMGIIEDNDRNGFFIESDFHDGLLDSPKEDVFSVKDLPAEEISQLAIEIGD